jgi:RHS repeat-associated protein
LIAVTNALNQVTRYQYDEMGNETKQIDALNRTNAYAYDGQGRRVAHWLPNTNMVEQFGYDFNSNLAVHTNFNGTVLANTYDGLNRLTSVNNGNTTYNVGYQYTATGKRFNMAGYVSGGLQSYYYYYDSRDRLIQKQALVVNGNWNYVPTLYYAYDVNGNLTNLWTGDNDLNIIYSYDPLNRLTNVSDSVSGVSAGYGYDHVGNLQGMVYGNGVTNVYQYDSLNRLTNLVWQYGSAARAKFAYQVDLTGNRTNLIETVNTTSQTNAWSFDNIYRLTNEVAGVLGHMAYQYDPVGNRQSRNSTVTGVTNQMFTFNTNDWLSTDQYDADGNTTNSLNSAYQYDPADEVTNVNNVISMVYDGDRSRVMKQVGGLTTYYVVDDQNPSGYPQVLEELVGSGNGYPQTSKTYIYGSSLVGQQQFSTGTLGTLSYYGFDGHGSVRFLMGTSGNITDTYTYDAFGNIISRWYGGSGATPNNYLYSGQQFDPDLGLYYNRARYLNPNVGRFWTMDSYAGNNEDPLSLHKYLYTQDNPVNGIDPSGHDDIGDVLGAMDISASLDALLNIMTVQGALSTIAFSPSIIVKFSVDTSDKPPSFHADRVQNLLQTQLSTEVFDNPPAGHSVKIEVQEEGGNPGTLGWIGTPKNTYINRVNWNKLSGIEADRDSKGNILISDEKVEEAASQYTANVSDQTWANILAHEGIWGNAGGNWDSWFVPNGDIGAGSLVNSANLFVQFGVSGPSRTKLRSEFGF